MAIGTINKPNTLAPSLTNPYGYIKDDSGANDGTPVNTVVYGDIHAFFDALMADAGLSYNGNPDNAVNGFQLRSALIGAIRALVLPSTTNRGVVRYATDNQLIAGTETDAALTPSNLGAWTLRSVVSDVTVAGGSGTTVTACSIRYKLLGKTMFMEFFAQITNTTAPTSFEILIPASKQWKSFGSLTSVSIGAVIGNGTNNVAGRIVLRDSDKTKIQILPLTGVTLTNTEITTISGSITFEVA